MIQPNGQVHPVAALFPMMSEEEIADLAADIAANGLQQPIVLDSDGTLIDGRNRLVACERAEIKPTFTSLNGHDPVAYILSANITRRHLNKGQRAMALVKARSLNEKSKPLLSKDSFASFSEEAGLSSGYVSQALTVFRYSPDCAELVLAGTMTLNIAYSIASERKKAVDSTDVQMARLRGGAPDLAELVDEDRMSLEEAQAALAKREQERERREQEEYKGKQDYTRSFWAAIAILDPRDSDPLPFAEKLLKQLLLDKIEETVAPTPDRLRQCIAVLENLIPAMEDYYGRS